jgi:hypothetical protein
MTTTAQPSSLAARLMIGGRVFGQREVDVLAPIQI